MCADLQFHARKAQGVDLFYSSELSLLIEELPPSQRDFQDQSRFSQTRLRSPGTRAMLNMMAHPSASIDEINTRRELISSLHNNNFNLQACAGKINSIYSLSDSIDELFFTEDDSVPIINQLINEHHLTVSNCLEKSQTNSELTALNAITSYIANCHTLIAQLNNNQNKTMCEIAEQLRDGWKAVGLDSVEQLISYAIARDIDQVRVVLQRLKDFESILHKFDGIVTFANIVAIDKLTPVTFEAGKQEYKGAWHFEFSKYGTYFTSLVNEAGQPDPEGQTGQVRAHSPVDKPIQVGESNTQSGKSFDIDRELWLQRCAQTFGYAPCDQGANLHLYKNIVVIRRPARGVDKTRSSFTTEVGFVNRALDLAKPGTRVLWDEAGSTTSYEDGFRFVVGAVYGLRLRGAEVRVTCHNDLVIQHYEQDPQATIYHFKSAKDLNGTLAHSFVRESGRTDLDPYAVARDQRYPQGILKRAERYSQGKVTPINIPPTIFPELTQFTEEERTSMKQKVVGISCLSPILSDLEVTDEELSPPKREPKLLDIERFNPVEFFNGPDNPTSTLIMSDDPDFKYVGANLLPADQLYDRHTALITALLYGASNDPQEVLERQRMYDALIADNMATSARLSLSKVFNFLAIIGDTTYKSHDNFCAELIRSGYEDILFSGTSLSSGDPKESIRSIEPLLMSIDVAASLLGDRWDRSKIDALVAKINRYFEYLLQLSQLENEELNSAQIYRNLETLFEQEPGTLTESNLPGLSFSIKLEFQDLIKNIPKFAITPDNADYVSSVIDKFDVAALSNKHRVAFMSPRSLTLLEFTKCCLDKEDYLGAFVNLLRSADSVYLHQLSNYVESITRPHTLGFKSGREIWESTYRNDPRTKDHNFGAYWITIGRELIKFQGLFSFAEKLAQSEFCSVEFNNSGVFRATNLWNISSKPDDQTAVDLHISPDKPIHLLESPNESGKSYHQKRAFLALCLAQATGRMPAKTATAPIYAGMIYSDRVSEELDFDLSGFGSEALQRRVIDNRLNDQRPHFLCIDEPSTTIPSKFQNPFTYGVIEDVAARGHTAIIAGHHHASMEKFAEVNGHITESYYFSYSLGEDGNINFNRAPTKGRAPSLALEVALSRGLDPEIVRFARGLPLPEMS